MQKQNRLVSAAVGIDGDGDRIGWYPRRLELADTDIG